MTALSASPGTVVPAPRAAAPQIPTPRRPVDLAPAAPDRHGRHRLVEPARTEPQAAQTSRMSRTSELVTLAARAGTVVTLAAMLVAAAAAAGLTDGVAPSGDAATVATSTLR